MSATITRFDTRVTQVEAAESFGFSLSTLKRKMKTGLIQLAMHKDGDSVQAKVYCYVSDLTRAHELYAQK